MRGWIGWHVDGGSDGAVRSDAVAREAAEPRVEI